jgi:4-amino-4-deoxy-L-arabinose transferase-like glycosyltransferase
MLKNNYAVFASFVFISVAMRFFSFFPSVINHDESTYLVIADAITKGAQYYINYVDIKPPGIFIIIASYMHVFGNSIFLFRMFTSIILATTAFMLYLIKVNSSKEKSAAISTGIIYIFLTSVFTFFGVSPNTELYFNLFTALALFSILREKPIHTLVAGVFLGAGFVIKFMIAFDALAIGLGILLLGYRENSFSKSIRKVMLLFSGFCVPILALCLYYLSIGEFNTLVYYNFQVSQSYAQSMSVVKLLNFIADFHLRFIPIVLLVIFSFNKKSYRHKFLSKQFYLIWYGLVLIAVILPQKTFAHYWVQAMIPLSLMAGEFFIRYPSFLKFQRFNVWKAIVPLLLLLNIFAQWNDYFRKTDYPREIAEYIKPQLTDGDIIYTANYQHIMYLLTDTKCPTPYVHRTLIYRENLSSVLGIDPETEFRKIAAQKPKFYLHRIKEDDLFGSFVENEYHLVKRFDNGVDVYKRNTN